MTTENDEVIDEVLELSDDLLSQALDDVSDPDFLNFTEDMPHLLFDDDGDMGGSSEDYVYTGTVTVPINTDPEPIPIIISSDVGSNVANLQGSFKLDGSLEVSHDGVRQGSMVYFGEDNKLYTFGETGEPIGLVLEPGFDSNGKIVEVSFVAESANRFEELKKRIAKLEEENGRLKSYDRFDILDIEDYDGP